MVLGIDGADPHTIDLLVSEGKLPHFAKMRKEGAYAPLLSAKPLLSPVIWTTIATGKTPDQHRIGHFVAVNPVTGEQIPVTSRMRKVKALWNILSEAGRKVDVVGWWATWPPETVNGSIVSDHVAYHFLFPEGFDRNAPKTANTYPPELEQEIAPLVRRPQDVSYEEVSRFLHISPEEFNRPFRFEDPVGHFKWAYATAESYSAIGLDLWKKERPDVLMVYIEGVDSVSHLFGHLFRAESLSGELAAQQKKYGDAVEQMYVEADRIVGRYMDAMDDDTTLIVISDHGFELGALQDDPSKTRDMRRVSERFHRLRGISYAYGAHVNRGGSLGEPTILDVAPTVLALEKVPAAADMPGRAMTTGIDVAPLVRVKTYESGKAVPEVRTTDSNVDPEVLEHLRSLGYLGATSPTGDENIAGILFEEGKYKEAVEAYRKLVEKSPDDGHLRASYAGALGALGRYDDALKQLDAAIRLEPLNVEAYHNRAVLHERKGERDAAIRDYQTALRYNPQYEPSQKALTRLGVSTDPDAPKSAEEKKAWELARAAADDARRGSYADAMSKLDQAEKLAPRYVLVYQYRSNVAYLMGDREAAAAALRKALEIEPDNALFKANLEALTRKQTAAPGK